MTPKEVLCGIFGRCSNERSNCNCTPPPKKGSNNKTAPSSSARNQQYASRITKDSSNPTLNTEAIGVGTTAPIPSKQVVTRLWSKGAVVKQISSVQDESTKKLPPHHSMGMGLRKSPPELNAAAVKTKSPTNSVAAAASTLIYQKNYVDGNSGGKGGRTDHFDVLELHQECHGSY